MGYSSLMKSGAMTVRFHAAMGRNLLEMMPIQQSIALLVGTESTGLWQPGGVSGEGICAVGELHVFLQSKKEIPGESTSLFGMGIGGAILFLRIAGNRGGKKPQFIAIYELKCILRLFKQS